MKEDKVGPKDGGDFVGGNYVATINLSAELPILQSMENKILIFFMMLQMFGELIMSSAIDDSNKIRSSTGIRC